MVWRDLDITLAADGLSLERFFEMGNRICTVVQATSMFFCDTRAVSVENRPSGLYWGVVLATEAHHRWQWDIWAVSRDTCRGSVAYCKDILERLSPEKRSYILAIKSSVYDKPEYGRDYGSKDIYQAVLNHGVITVADFDRYLQTPK